MIPKGAKAGTAARSVRTGIRAQTGSSETSRDENALLEHDLLQIAICQSLLEGPEKKVTELEEQVELQARWIDDYEEKMDGKKDENEWMLVNK